MRACRGGGKVDTRDLKSLGAKPRAGSIPALGRSTMQGYRSSDRGRRWRGAVQIPPSADRHQSEVVVSPYVAVVVPVLVIVLVLVGGKRLSFSRSTTKKVPGNNSSCCLAHEHEYEHDDDHEKGDEHLFGESTSLY